MVVKRVYHCDSVWDGVPRPKPLQDLVGVLRDKKEDPAKRQQAINLLNAAIRVMETVRGRRRIIEYLCEEIEKARNDLYPRRG